MRMLRWRKGLNFIDYDFHGRYATKEKAYSEARKILRSGKHYYIREGNGGYEVWKSGKIR